MQTLLKKHLLCVMYYNKPFFFPQALSYVHMFSILRKFSHVEELPNT